MTTICPNCGNYVADVPLMDVRIPNTDVVKAWMWTCPICGEIHIVELPGFERESTEKTELETDLPF